MTRTDLRPAHSDALGAATAQVGRITAHDLARSTPCAEWDLGALLAHMVGQHRGFAAALRDGDAPVSAFAPVPWSRAAWSDSVAELEAAFAASDLDTRVVLIELAPTPLPVSVLLAAHHLDTVVHTWDLARTLGEAFVPPADVVAIVAEVMALVPDDDGRTRSGAPFGPALTDDGEGDGGGWDHVLRHLGRDPAWTP